MNGPAGNCPLNIMATKLHHASNHIEYQKIQGLIYIFFLQFFFFQVVTLVSYRLNMFLPYQQPWKYSNIYKFKISLIMSLVLQAKEIDRAINKTIRQRIKHTSNMSPEDELNPVCCNTWGWQSRTLPFNLQHPLNYCCIPSYINVITAVVNETWRHLPVDTGIWKQCHQKGSCYY